MSKNKSISISITTKAVDLRGGDGGGISFYIVIY